MEKSLLFARASLFIALISAFEIYGETKDSRSVSLVVIAFFATLFWRDWRFGSYDFFGDLSTERSKANRSSVFVFGSRIDSSKPEVQERDVLLDEELLRYRTQSIIGYWAVIAAFGALMHWRFGAFPFSGTVLVAFLICFPLSFATHYSQQLIPLFLSLLGVMITLWKHEFPSKTLLVVYVLGSFATIAFLQNIRLNFISRSFGSAPWLQDVLKRAIVAGVGFCVLVYAVTKLFPEQNAVASVQPEAKSELRQQAIDTVAKQLAKLEKRETSKPNPVPKPAAVVAKQPGFDQPAKPSVAAQDKPAENQAPPNEQLKQTLDKGSARPSGANYDPEALKKLMAMKTPTGGGGKGVEAKEPQEGNGDTEAKEPSAPDRESAEQIAKELSNKSPEELEALKDQLNQEIAKAEQSAKHPEQAQALEHQPNQAMPNGNLKPGDVKSSDLKPGDIAKLQKQLANQDPKEVIAHLEKLRDLKKQVDQTSIAKTKSAGEAKRAGTDHGTGEAKPTSNDQPTTTSADQTNKHSPDVQTSNVNTDVNINGNSNDKRSSPPAPAAKQTAPTPPDEDAKDSDRVKELALEIDKKLEKVESLIPYVVFGLLGLVIGVWIVKWLRRSQKKDVLLTLSEEEKRELSDELKSIRQRKLTPQQEIIETYNVMMEVLERVQLGREEGRPARVHAADLKKRIPKMGSSVFEATDGFDAALYGDLDPGGDQLAKFRKSTKSVFRLFDIAA